MLGFEGLGSSNVEFKIDLGVSELRFRGLGLTVHVQDYGCRESKD